MNLFILDSDPSVCARYHSDVHVNKMATECGQIITAAIAVITLSYDLVPGKTKMVTRWKKPFESAWGVSHPHHPATRWVTESYGNGVWTISLWKHLCAEWRHRFDKIHGSESYIPHAELAWMNLVGMCNTPHRMQTPFVVAFDRERYADCLCSDVIESYRKYYRTAKSTFPKHGPATWTRRERPFFMNAETA